MALRTAFTELLGLRHPIALAPMGGSAGGALAAAVCNAGGLGLLGSGNGNRNWLARELPIVTGGTRGPWGVGFQSWAVTRATIERALEARPSAVVLDEASQAIDLITDLPPAAEVVGSVAAQAEDALARALGR